jgi:TonB family protein
MRSLLFLGWMIGFSLLIVISCNKGDELLWEDGPCFVEVDGEFQDIEPDQMPEYFNGGNEGFYRDLLKALQYPAEARENGIEGKCILNYEISTTGEVENIAIISDPGGGIGAATRKALETITEEGPSFSPAIYEGLPVRVRKELIVNFKLEG